MKLKQRSQRGLIDPLACTIAREERAAAARPIAGPARDPSVPAHDGALRERPHRVPRFLEPAGEIRDAVAWSELTNGVQQFVALEMPRPRIAHVSRTISPIERRGPALAMVRKLQCVVAPGTGGMTMALGEEMSNLDFSSMIGGPLSAVIRAQAQSAQTSVDFIKSVGFDQNGQPTMVSFQYKKLAAQKDASGKPVLDTTGKPVFAPTDYTLTVPILTMLPIPFICVKDTTIDFNAKITSVQESTTSSSQDLSASLSAKGGWGPVSAELKVSYAYKKATTEGSKVERTYSMAVHVEAVQDELPEGTARLLSILENNIKEVPTKPA